MTSTSEDLRYVFKAAGPLIEQQLDMAEACADLREFCRSKNLDWAQIKALRKAQIEDDRDGTGENPRVNKILEKAGCATAYADMLKLGTQDPEKNHISRAVEAQKPIPAPDVRP